jgi:protein-S-isoprenylcysteine O-methyltransferase Ste14
MNPTTRSAIHDGGRTAPRLTRRAENAATHVVVAFWALFVFSAELPSVRAHSPWTEDPYDVVISFAALLVHLVAVVTFVRCQRWRGLAPMLAPAVRHLPTPHSH